MPSYNSMPGNDLNFLINGLSVMHVEVFLPIRIFVLANSMT